MPGLSKVLRHPVGHTRTEFVVLLTDQQRAYLNECKQCAGDAGRSMSDGEVLYHLLDRLISDDGFPSHSVAGVWSYAEPEPVWAPDARDGMRYPEASDLTGGETDLHHSNSDSNTRN